MALFTDFFLSPTASLSSPAITIIPHHAPAPQCAKSSSKLFDIPGYSAILLFIFKVSELMKDEWGPDSELIYGPRYDLWVSGVLGDDMPKIAIKYASVTCTDHMRIPGGVEGM
ncbi:hypothetical protein GWI33_013984 [Rhynchophorus ferrugineus]|uniref:Uncharacterized protein n=1 Tax=Rhynchophorus ferrugineus TaxID=354439 RepID=A0A834M9H4_RHYFE|nr:hypothetical protein GWI33_013984 [Rhynchophorus ferrugineus]